MQEFPINAPVANAVFYRTYSRFNESGTESWDDVCTRTVDGLKEIGKLSNEESELIDSMQRKFHSLSSGRWLWVGGTEWIKKPSNFIGAYNCNSTSLVDENNIRCWHRFALLMDNSMQGCGIGTSVELSKLESLPTINTTIDVHVINEIGTKKPIEHTIVNYDFDDEDTCTITVGDSRQGWVKSYETLLSLSTSGYGNIKAFIDVGHIRANGERIKGFGGISNSVILKDLYPKITKILNRANGRKLTSDEAILLIDEPAKVVVAGNVRRSAGMKQGSPNDPDFVSAKENLWKQNADGKWSIDPERDAMRMSNHTQVYHHKPSLQECVESVRKQFYSGEGAIQWAGEAVARANADLLTTKTTKQVFIEKYQVNKEVAKNYLQGVIAAKTGEIIDNRELEHRLDRYHLNPCFAAGTMILTRKGHFPIEELIGKETEVWDGEQWVVIDSFRVTGENQPVYKITLNSGQEVLSTEYHTFILDSCIKKQLKELKVGDKLLTHNIQIHGTQKEFGAYVKGFLIGDGTSSNDKVALKIYDPKLGCKKRLIESLEEIPSKILSTVNAGRFTPLTKSDFTETNLMQGLNGKEEDLINWVTAYRKHFPLNVLNWDLPSKLDFIAGVMDSDGCASDTKNGWMYQISSIHYKWLQGFQLLLKTIGVDSKLSLNKKAGITDFKDKGGLCKTQPLYRLTISQESSIILSTKVVFSRLISFANKKTSYKLKSKQSIITSITFSHIADKVYCCTVPNHQISLSNGLITGQCGEIIGKDFLCVGGNTKIITKDGISSIQSLVNQPVEVWNGKQWSSVVPILTGSDRKLLRVSFSDGSYLDVTENHRFLVQDRFGFIKKNRDSNLKDYAIVEAKDLLKTGKYILHTPPVKIEYNSGLTVDPSEAYTLGVVVGDGYIQEKSDKTKKPRVALVLHGSKKNLPILGKKSEEKQYQGYSQTCIEVSKLGWLDHFIVKALKETAIAFEQIATWEKTAILHFLAGLADADGSNTDSGGIRIYVSGYDRACMIQLLLTKCGINSSVLLIGKKGDKTNKGIRGNDLYAVSVLDCSNIPCHRLDTSRSHQAKYKSKWQSIKSVVELDGLYDTYCFNEPIYHSAVFGNTLTKNCNLSEVHLNTISPYDFDTQSKAFKAASLSVAALLNHQFPEEIYRYSREIDPIVGVSFTGLFDYFVKAFGKSWLKWWEAGRPEEWHDSVKFDDNLFTPSEKQDLSITQKLLEATFTNTAEWFNFAERITLMRWKNVVSDAITEYCNKHKLKVPNRYTTVQPAGCLTADAVRIFDQGLLLSSDNMGENDGEVDLSGLNLSVREGIKVSKGIANNKMNLIKITFSNGRELTLTPNHRLAVQGFTDELFQWKHAIDFQLGDRIVTRLGCYTKTSNTKLEANKEGFPTEITPLLSYFLGLINCTDILISENKAVFTTSRKWLLNKIQKVGAEIFGVEFLLDSAGKLSTELSILDFLLNNGLIERDLTVPHQIQYRRVNFSKSEIPYLVRTSSKLSILHYISGVVDSSIQESEHIPSITSGDKAWLQHIFQIGECVGLSCNLIDNVLYLDHRNSIPNSFNTLCLAIRYGGIKSKFSDYTSMSDGYTICQIQYDVIDYTYDYGVDGKNDDDSWYWQGAIKSHNTKSLLTNASPGWHPPKAQRFIRRVTFRRDDPVALACIDYGYNVIPSQADKDENGHLLDDPFDPRCTEWLVEIPVSTDWADIAEGVDISKFSAAAQFDFYMQVQKYYTTHNTSATLEIREHEIEDVGTSIYKSIQSDEGYISAALLARFDSLETFPRLPFEPIDKITYEKLQQDVLIRRKSDNFHALLDKYKKGEDDMEGPAGCDGDKCLLPQKTV